MCKKTSNIWHATENAVEVAALKIDLKSGNITPSRVAELGCKVHYSNSQAELVRDSGLPVLRRPFFMSINYSPIKIKKDG